MKALFIGGIGTISTAIVQRLVLELGWEVWVLNRSGRVPAGCERAHSIIADIHNEALVADRIRDLTFDVVCEFRGYEAEDMERDYRLFRDKTKQYILISSSSAYHKPARSYIVTEGTTLANPHSAYARGKIACEEYLMKKYREEGFPVTIVRPSHTYCERAIPVGVRGNNGSWQVVKRMLEGKPVIIQGDGTSLWTLTWCGDFAVGFTGLMGNAHAIGEAFHLTGDETLTWNQIYEAVAGALGVKLHAYHVASDYLAEVGKKAGYDFEAGLLGDKAASLVFDNSKLKRAVPEMRTTVRFDQGARMVAEYVLSHPEECQQPDPDFDAWCDRVIAAQEASKTLI